MIPYAGIPPSLVASVGLAHSITDAVVIPVDESGYVAMDGALGDRTLASPNFVGQMLLLNHVSGPAFKVTVIDGVDEVDNDTLNFSTTLGQAVLLIGVNTGVAILWHLIWQDSHGDIPVLLPVINDPGNGGIIDSESDGALCTISILSNGENRILRRPIFAGQTLSIQNASGTGYGTVTVDWGVDPCGNTKLFFVPASTEVQTVTLVSEYTTGGYLCWRVLKINNITSVSRAVIDPSTNLPPAAGASIPVTYEDGLYYLDIEHDGDNRNLASPVLIGQRLTIIHNAGDHAGTVTVTDGYEPAGSLGAKVLDFLPISVETQEVILTATTTSSGLRWRLLADNNAIPCDRTIADPGVDARFVVNRTNGIAYINIAVSGDDRVLPDPIGVGNTLTIVHYAGTNIGTITAIYGHTITAVGATKVHFTITLGEYIKFTSCNVDAVGTLRWRVTENPDNLLID
jgi:hypothetical protein